MFSVQTVPQSNCLNSFTFISHWICMPLLQNEFSDEYEFSYVSSNGLAEQMQSRIGCICMVFLQSEFSDDSSNGLAQRMHGHIGCICIVFLQSGFANESSNCLPEQMHSRIGCICMFFSGVSFQMHPQIACLNRCKVALIAFTGFSRECVFKCVFKWSADE